jgi:hypothetical protein
LRVNEGGRGVEYSPLSHTFHHFLGM